MKQKLVLISSIFSFGYTSCSPEMTLVNARPSVGSVGGRSSVSCADKTVSDPKARVARKGETDHGVLAFLDRGRDDENGEAGTADAEPAPRGAPDDDIPL